MFDFHMHSKVSFDGHDSALQMALAAKKAGLTHICFTEHLDYDPLAKEQTWTFDTDEYNAALNDLKVPGLEIGRGVEFGMLPDNRETLKQDLKRRHFDFVIGSVHFAGGIDAYYPEFWEGKTQEQAERHILEETLACVKHHDDFDVLGHLTYICKTHSNPVKRPIILADYQDIVDEIFKTLVSKGKGIEVNTSAIDVCGVYLPEREYLLRFKELGGEIVTVGSDAHNTARVGQYCREAAKMVQDIFSYVCAYRDRKPIFHRF